VSPGAITSQGLDAGFADPVRDAQGCFRAVLDAMSRPGRIATVTGVTAPGPVCAAAGAVLLTLVDHETPLWLDPDAERARRWIEFHCSAPIVADPSSCGFALALSLPDLGRLPAGTHESPETSATVICQVQSFTAGKSFRLSGPGLREPEMFSVAGLPRDFASIWRRNHALFPRGIDLILCADDQLTALPRTVSIEEI
jgi:alpha-D-ribose 1-methylphosphonate 5-triphosphate synthase subunit PhnH